MSDVPVFGAQIFIEPGQTPADIDNWFRMLKENGMKTTRIRMFESYMHKSDGTWDFSLFDLAFKAADKYGIQRFIVPFSLTLKKLILEDLSFHATKPIFNQLHCLLKS